MDDRRLVVVADVHFDGVADVFGQRGGDGRCFIVGRLPAIRTFITVGRWRETKPSADRTVIRWQNGCSVSDLAVSEDQSRAVASDRGCGRLVGGAWGERVARATPSLWSVPIGAVGKEGCRAWRGPPESGPCLRGHQHGDDRSLSDDVHQRLRSVVQLLYGFLSIGTAEPATRLRFQR
ncbi:hypothetical protein D8S78_12375 [Natrialba swarupiae]|nr:hypothetical protein [Natrialba swarupiae]